MHVYFNVFCMSFLPCFGPPPLGVNIATPPHTAVNTGYPCYWQHCQHAMHPCHRKQVAAFEAFNDVPKVCLFDNMKTVVLERQGSAIRFHPELLALSSHYHFEPRAVAPARGNEKRRVERAIRYIRDNFFAGRHYTSLEDLNEQALAWCMDSSADRRCPEDPQLTVREAFAQEQAFLLPLPDNPFDTREQVVARVQKTPYVRFDGNQYSVSHQHVQTAVTVSE